MEVAAKGLWMQNVRIRRVSLVMLGPSDLVNAVPFEWNSFHMETISMTAFPQACQAKAW